MQKFFFLKSSNVNFIIHISTFSLQCMMVNLIPASPVADWTPPLLLQVQPASGARTVFARPRAPLGPAHSPGLFKCSPASLQWALLLSSLCAPARRILASDRRTERTVCVTHLSVWTSCGLETVNKFGFFLGEFVLLLCAERPADKVDKKCV